MLTRSGYPVWVWGFKYGQNLTLKTYVVTELNKILELEVNVLYFAERS
jgi:hypothetical protein